MRVKRGTFRHAKHKKMIKLAKGYVGRRKSVFKLAKQAVIKAGQYAYRDRRVKKREFRSIWIIKINAGLKKVYAGQEASDAWRLIRYNIGHRETAAMRQDVLNFFRKWL